MGGGTGRDEGDDAPRWRDPKQALCEAVLALAGEGSIENTHVQLILNRADVTRDSFYEHFDNPAHCFMVAYEQKAWEVCEEILLAGRDGTDWVEGLRGALRVALTFVAEQPHTAAALLIEGGAAGSATGPIHNSVLKRLARALESARRQPGSRHSAPPLTADLMIGAINNTLQGLLVKGEAARAPELLEDFVYLVLLAFFSEEAAGRAAGSD